MKIRRGTAWAALGVTALAGGALAACGSAGRTEERDAAAPPRPSTSAPFPTADPSTSAQCDADYGSQVLGTVTSPARLALFEGEVFVREASRVRALRLDGGGERTVTSVQTASAEHLAFAVDADGVYYAEARGSETVLMRVPRIGGAPVRVDETSDAGDAGAQALRGEVLGAGQEAVFVGGPEGTRYPVFRVSKETGETSFLVDAAHDPGRPPVSTPIAAVDRIWWLADSPVLGRYVWSTADSLQAHGANPELAAPHATSLAVSTSSSADGPAVIAAPPLAERGGPLRLEANVLSLSPCGRAVSLGERGAVIESASAFERVGARATQVLACKTARDPTCSRGAVADDGHLVWLDASASGGALRIMMTQF